MAAAAEGMEFSYFPGCSLATSAKENNRSLLKVCQKLGFNLVELEDWNCCGSSSTHSINSELAFHFACPSCMLLIQGAVDVKADCIITACAMCHLNLEIRCSLKTQLPIFHFSEILSIALGMGIKKSWLKRHLVDPLPLLSAKGFLEKTAAS